MSPFDQYIDEFCWIARRQLENDLESQRYGSLLDLSTSVDSVGLWATATLSLAGHDEPWEFCRLVLPRTEFASNGVPGRGEVEATIFTTVLTEVLDTRPWPPSDYMSLRSATPSPPPGSVEAWPGGPHLRSLAPDSLRGRYLKYIRELHAATWPRLHAAIARDPWIGLKPEFSEDPAGVWLTMSMRQKSSVSRKQWTYRELVIGPDGPAEAADVVGDRYTDRAIIDFEHQDPFLS
ncbi:hypothetical protein GCM10017673_35200 [Streptosporangium violaceochromogenes]|nr:hypothetical protein GCM10017673_35200 [Streptosporangium violaceochromogenes]